VETVILGVITAAAIDRAAIDRAGTPGQDPYEYLRMPLCPGR
jgi:hypothetical protein